MNDVSFKYEEVYLKSYQSVREMGMGLEGWFAFYNHDRPHQSLAYRTPAEVYHDPTPINPRGGETPQTIT